MRHKYSADRSYKMYQAIDRDTQMSTFLGKSVGTFTYKEQYKKLRTALYDS